MHNVTTRSHGNINFPFKFILLLLDFVNTLLVQNILQKHMICEVQQIKSSCAFCYKQFIQTLNLFEGIVV